jgi:alpha-mannosidase
VIVRFFNITDEPLTGARIAMPGAKRLRLVNLNEEAQEEWREGDTLQMEVGAKKIVTVEFGL